MSSLKPITIVGGGLAGLTLGIGLRQRGIPVTVWEAGGYPRHRVCGEFINGRGQEVLVRLGLWEPFLKAGAIMGQDAAFFQGDRASPARPVNPPALCLSRFTIDALLAGQLRACGGKLREHMRWPGECADEGVVRANGRRTRPVAKGWRWFGLKAHVRGVDLAAALEMHVLDDGYVGLCRLPGEKVNACGLFRRRSRAGSPSAPWRELLSGPPGSALRERLAGAEFDVNSFCSVAGLTLRPGRASMHAECCIGDALTMIPPVTGNGMSMALEAAGIALEPLSAWSRGELDWSRARQALAHACDRAFASRLAWARRLQWLMLAPFAHGRIGTLALRSDFLWRFLFARTR
jgi:2-polyprenyl-6-methoxyphenol hydroxylase-like FAD-dependent oxidoreductase